jgi:hypothetical protein
MTGEVKSRIFDPFFTTKKDSGGTGLGMSISYGIIQEHGGHIEIETQPGKGATFIFHLPARRADAEKQAAETYRNRLEAVYNGTHGSTLKYVFDDRHKDQCCYLYADIILGYPIAVSLFVRGDGSLHQLRIAYRDRLDRRFTVSLTQNALLNTEWHVVSARVPEDAEYPLRLESIYVLRNSDDHIHTSGLIGIDDISAHYRAD